MATNPVGTGPFKFVRWRKDDQLVLESNEAYWRGAHATRLSAVVAAARRQLSQSDGGSVDH